MKLHNVRLLAAQFEAMFRFYRDTLGIQPSHGEETGTYASFDLPGGSSIALFRREHMAAAVGTTDRPADAAAQDRFALILEVDGLDARVDALATRGVAFLAPPRDMPDWGIRVAHLRDPDGNLLELYEDLPKDRWREQLQEEDTQEAGR
jgi:catechol 2,3-dioxygenase-like lactoylglutathione lyase family enzyme